MKLYWQVCLHSGHRPAQHVGAAAEAPPARGAGDGGPVRAGVHAEGRNLGHRQQKELELVPAGRRTVRTA